MGGLRARIVFVGGYARTGSTLTDRLIGQMDGFASLGEVRRVWDRCFLGNQLCGCGQPFHSCPFWREVVELAFGGFGGVDALGVLHDKTGVDNFWNIPQIALGGWARSYRQRLARYQDVLGRFYAAIQTVSGARFLVDSTKDPQHAYILKSIPGFDVRMLHLVRDSRAVAYSWQRVKRRPEIYWRDQDMARFPVTRTALAWNLTNLAADFARRAGFRYTRVRYEDLVRDPRRELARGAAELDLGPVDLSFLDAGAARLTPAHTVAGNPMRFQVGTIRLHSDDEWSRAMRPLDRRLVTALSMPLLARYGYPVGRIGAGSDVAEELGAYPGEHEAPGGSTDLSVPEADRR